MRLSQRVYLLQQVLPLLLLMATMLYEVTRHLVFPSVGHPALLAVEVLTFGIAGPALLWLTLNWIGGEIRAREVVEGELDTRTRMLLEMHHRIKNNLQTIADLLSLEMTRAEGRSAAESLRDSVARIKSIAAAHELLSTDQLGVTDVTELARRVTESARAGLARGDQNIAVAVNGAAIFLPSKSATAFALVINELVSNALEHGLAAQRTGAIDITLERVGAVVWVQVQDDGVGVAADFDWARGAGLGLRIVRTLVEKDLRGTIRLFNHAGTRVEFSFPLA